MWCLWRELNARCFEEEELSGAKMKFLLLHSLSEWTTWSSLSSNTRFLDFLDSLRSP